MVLSHLPISSRSRSHGCPGIHRQRSPGRLPPAGCEDQRQALEVIVRQMMRKVEILDPGGYALPRAAGRR